MNKDTQGKVSQGGVSLQKKIGYSLGHVLNDLSATYFFSYLIVYLKLSNGLEPNYSGYIFFVSQLSDTVINPILGIIQDRIVCCEILGKRTAWYIIGTIAATTGFAVIFNVTLGDADDTQLNKLLYYMPLVVFGAFGYTFVQLTHLAILPEISPLETERIQLNSWRNAATLVSNLIVYCGTWLLLSLQTGDNNVGKLTTEDVGVFQMLSQIFIGVGLFISMLFCLLIRENSLCCCRRTRLEINKETYEESSNIHNSFKTRYTAQDSNILYLGKYVQRSKDTKDGRTETSANLQHISPVNTKDDNKIHEVISAEKININHVIGNEIDNNKPFVKQDKGETSTGSLYISDPAERKWLLKLLKDSMFYEVAVIYSCTRFGVLISQIYIPLYVIETLKMDKVAIGILPLIIYVSGFVASLLMKRLNKQFGIKKIFIAGEILTLSACVWIFFITPSAYQQIYVVSIVFGVGQATLNVTSVALITDLIGQHAENSAAVFGMIGFTEKLLQTIFLLVSQIANTCGQEDQCSDFYRIIMVSAPGITTIIASVVMAIRQIRNRMSKEEPAVDFEKSTSGVPGLDEEVTHI